MKGFLFETKDTVILDVSFYPCISEMKNASLLFLLLHGFFGMFSGNTGQRAPYVNWKLKG